MQITDLIKTECKYIKGADYKDIINAEDKLGIKFSEEYKEYLSLCGYDSINGHELTGICNNERLNVVNVTEKNRIRSPEVNSEWYVIEETHIDGIVIWQNEKGEIYATEPGYKPQLIKDCMYEYIIS